jgi:hypothetical protein
MRSHTEILDADRAAEMETELDAIHCEIEARQDSVMTMATARFIDLLHADDADGAAVALRDLVVIGVRNEVIRRRLGGLEE